jgi:hypothetical protein
MQAMLLLFAGSVLYEFATLPATVGRRTNLVATASTVGGITLPFLGGTGMLENEC